MLCGTDRLDKENSLVLFLHVANNGLNDFPEVTQNVSRRERTKLTLPEPALHFQSKISTALMKKKKKRKSRKEEKGLVKAEHTASQLLIGSTLIEAKLLHSSAASSMEFTSETKILAET